tara:strand:+ start:727 stop:1128 length:402 start_codon:yes stop_codon:yes gene_type:complete
MSFPACSVEGCNAECSPGDNLCVYHREVFDVDVHPENRVMTGYAMDIAMQFLKAPIDREGYSDLPTTGLDPMHGLPTNQEEQDFNAFIQALPFDIDRDLTDEEAQMIIGIFNRLYQNGRYHNDVENLEWWDDQ